jgi:hypothetical protein
MDASDARDHLHMLDGIVRRTDRALRVPPVILMSVGLVCCTVTALIQARQMGVPVPPDQYLQPPLMLILIAVIGLTVWRGRHAGRETLIDAYAGAAFFAAFAVALTLNLTAQHRVISAAGMGLVWAASFSMALLIAGAMGSRILFAGGVALLAATGAASLVPTWLPGILAIGWFCGFFIPGIVLALGAPDGRTAAV